MQGARGGVGIEPKRLQVDYCKQLGESGNPAGVRSLWILIHLKADRYHFITHERGGGIGDSAKVVELSLGGWAGVERGDNGKVV